MSKKLIISLGIALLLIGIFSFSQDTPNEEPQVLTVEFRQQKMHLNSITVVYPNGKIDHRDFRFVRTDSSFKGQVYLTNKLNNLSSQGYKIVGQSGYENEHIIVTTYTLQK